MHALRYRQQAELLNQREASSRFEGTAIDIPGVMWFDVSDGLVARRTDLWDSLTFLRQTGQSD